MSVEILSNMMINQPNQTLYINNLNDKISKTDLKQSLYFLFSSFGVVLDIIALKTMKQRGQAFVCFEDLTCASEAMKSLQGFVMFDKPIKIAYAKDKSNVIKIKEGTILSRKVEKRFVEDSDDDDDTRKRIRQLEQVENANELLFLSNLPSDTTQEQLEVLFREYTGFKEVRMVPGKAEIAFVEYDNEKHATAARSVLNGFKITSSHAMNVQFAKR